MAKQFSITVIGYGSQGRAWAQNLQESGVDITVAIPSKDKSRTTAKKDGIKSITTVAKAVREADIIVFAFPDHLHRDVFTGEIAPNMKPDCTLLFLHGFSIHFKTITPPDSCDILLLAPLGPGVAVREKYLSGETIGYFYSIHRDSTGLAKKKLDYMVKAMKIDRSAMIETSMADEAVGDIFGEQMVLCGGLTQLIKNGYETLVENGLSSDKAYLEVAYQIDLIVDLIKKHGIEGMYKRISLAARYGSFVNGPRVIDDSVKRRMAKIYKEIKSGRFAGQLNSLTEADIEKLDNDLIKMTTPDFEKSAKKMAPRKTDKK